MRCLRTCTCTCDMSSLTCITYIPCIPIMNIARAPLRIGKVKGAPKRPIAIADGAFRGWCLQGNGSPGESRGPCWREERAHKGKLRDKEGCGSSAAKRAHVLQRISAVVVTASNRPRSASRDGTPRFSAKRGPVRSITVFFFFAWRYAINSSLALAAFPRRHPSTNSERVVVGTAWAARLSQWSDSRHHRRRLCRS